MKKINKILVVGYGSMGRRRIRLASELIPVASFICVDSNHDRQKQALDAGYMAYATLDEGIEVKPDIAFVCTSPGHHGDIIISLLSAGIHVFTELNLTSDKYDEIKATAAEHNVTIFISSTLVYKRQMEIFEETVVAQTKPVIYIYHVGQYLADWHLWENYKDFFISRKETSGIREIMAIQLPWIVRTFGKIKKVEVLYQRCTELEIEYPDSVVLNLIHENGNIGTFVADVVSRKAITCLEIIGEDVHIFWNGHNDDLYRLNLESKELESVKVYESEEHTKGYADVIAEEPYKDEIREFLRAINGEKIRYGLEEDAYVLNIIDRIENIYLKSGEKRDPFIGGM